MKKKLLALTLGLSALIGTVYPISKVKADSKPEPKTTDVYVNFNHGTNISWIEANQVIKNVWLDNPTFASLSFDGCVIGFNGCDKSDAQIVHLKRIKDLKLKGFVPAASTLMTVVVEDLDDGERHIQFFNIAKTNKITKTLISVPPSISPVASKPISPAPSIPLTQKPATELIEAISLALNDPNIETNIDRSIKRQLKLTKSLLELGNTEQQAMLMSGLNPEILQNLLKNSK